jgi:two-component system chemotaxis response regulator CheY
MGLSTGGKKKSIDDLKAKADAGNLEAQSALGLLFELGLEVEADPKEAAKYWGMAAKAGDAMAQMSLAGVISKNFEDTEEHRAMAQVLMKKAEEQGFVREDKAMRLLRKENGESIKVLLVDDSMTVRTPMKRYIEADGCEVVEASDGQEAIDILKKDKNIKMVFTDLNMPNVDGLTLIKIIRGIEALKSTPVVVVTTENHDNLVLKAKELGVQGWIVKPAKPHHIRRYLLKYT